MHAMRYRQPIRLTQMKRNSKRWWKMTLRRNDQGVPLECFASLPKSFPGTEKSRSPVQCPTRISHPGPHLWMPRWLSEAPDLLGERPPFPALTQPGLPGNPTSSSSSSSSSSFVKELSVSVPCRLVSSWLKYPPS